MNYNQNQYISLIDDINKFQTFSETTWVVNTMKNIRFFPEYSSNTYLVDARNKNNGEFLRHIADADTFGCFLDMRNIQGNYILHHLVVSCQQGTVIFFSFEKESNEIIKEFFSQISSRTCYGKGFTAYKKILHARQIPLKCKDIESSEYFANFQKFRNSISSIASAFDNYRTKIFSQTAENTNTVLECIALAFEAASIHYYITNSQVREFSMIPHVLNVNNVQQDYSLPPGYSMDTTPVFPPGYTQSPNPNLDNPALKPSSLSTSSLKSPSDQQIAKQENNVTFAPISPKMLQVNVQKKSKINKKFWKNLEMLAAILESTRKIETTKGNFTCKACKCDFDTYVHLLEHCWNNHQSALE
ncbi:hypothetical protein TRFO_35382 [Tritrichomonas foetus]|uniref:C2H2-type domain-containing protein n=1 Tax=Tritrichomonas foetus TaxID=1144522 RepID=A0A1J4JHQ6_9EUKA|nr:hypothetical protein TRFO_35382 [Tritrichomonas foetus]|eukprot:OHS98257.1 hypothetical protein TRFO_35382 [Tritrichomonas foetus]